MKTAGKHIAAAAIVVLSTAGCAEVMQVAQAVGNTPNNSLLTAAQRKVAAGADAKALREELSSVISGGCTTPGFPDPDCLARAYAPGAVEGRLEAARFLLDNGAGVNQARQDSPDVDWIKSEKPLPEAMRLLSNANGANDSATAGEVGKMAALLVSRGANVNDPVACFPDRNNDDVCRDTPLAIAAVAGNAELVSLLLEKGAKVSQSGHYNGLSLGAPLTHAAGGGHVEVVKLLLDKGAKDKKAALEAAQASLEYAETEAQKNRYREIISLLKSAGAGKSGKKAAAKKKR